MALHQINGIRVQTSFEYPPIPVRSFDWVAVDDDTYDCDCDQDGFFSNCPIGHGATEEDAIADLLEQIEDREAEVRVKARAAQIMDKFDATIAAIRAAVELTGIVYFIGSVGVIAGLLSGKI